MADLAAATANNNAAAVAVAQAKVERFKQWLVRQEVVLLPDGSIDWPQSQGQSKVVYDKDLAARKLTRVRLHGGLLFTDDAHRQLLDTTGMVTHFSGPGKAIYVMSQEGNLHVISHKVGLRHHTSPLAGGDVAGAGELEVLAGKLTWLSNKSGHYAPQIEHLAQVLHILKKAGCDMNLRLRAFTSDPAMKDDLDITDNPTPIGGGKTMWRRDYTSAQRFLDKLVDKDVDYELLKLLAYVHHFNAQIAKLKTEAGWRWREDDHGEKPGFYNIATGALVPHKDVRQWFKNRNLFANDIVQSGVGR
jgi:hypothetical protein